MRRSITMVVMALMVVPRCSGGTDCNDLIEQLDEATANGDRRTESSLAERGEAEDCLDVDRPAE